MGKKADIPFDKKKEIENLLIQGKLKVCEITTCLNVSSSAVYQIKGKIKHNQPILHSANVNNGPRRKTSSRDDRNIIKIVLENRNETLAQILQILSSRGINIGRTTLKQRLQESGISCCRKSKKFMLNSKMMKKRLAWAKSHQAWSLEKWRKVRIFSSEAVR